MKNLLLTSILCACPFALQADWEEDYVRGLKEEGYSKPQIKKMLEKEIVRREKAVAAKAERDAELAKKREALKKEQEAEAEKDRASDERQDKKEQELKNKVQSKLNKEEFIEKTLKSWLAELEENKWTEKEISKRRSDYKNLLKRYYGKEEDDIEKAYKEYQQKQGRLYAKTVLKDKKYNLLRDKVIEGYEKYVNINKSDRSEAITDMYIELIDKYKEERSEVMTKSYKALLKELKLVWLDKKLTRREEDSKKKNVQQIYSSLSRQLGKKDFESNIEKSFSKRNLTTQEKKLIRSALNACAPKL